MSKDSKIIWGRGIDALLIVVVIAVLITIGWLMIRTLNVNHETYQEAIGIARASKTPNHVLILAYTRALDFSTQKLCVVFTGFLLVFLGALYLLKIFAASYKLSVESSPFGKINLNSTSPGLIMMTLGLITVNIAYFKDSTIEYSTQGNSAGQSDTALLYIGRGMDAMHNRLTTIEQDVIELKKRKYVKPQRATKSKPPKKQNNSRPKVSTDIHNPSSLPSLKMPPDPKFEKHLKDLISPRNIEEWLRTIGEIRLPNKGIGT